MNKNCSRCNKIVYPIEELKCLDKTWHKTCFRCHECAMMLNMKTYKGFEKLPYCEAHIPKAKATVIADTPEIKRIAENTKIQSNVKYHADFEKQKGKLTQVADDPETLRIKQNTLIISNVAYHGDLEKKAAMEKQRGTAEIADNRDNESEYFSETLAAESFSQYRTHSPSQPQSHQQQSYYQQHNNQSQNSTTNYHQQQQQQQHGQPQQHQQQPMVNPTNIRSSIVQSSLNPSGAVLAMPPPQQQQQQQAPPQAAAATTAHYNNNNNNNNNSNNNYQSSAYYDQYENYARPNTLNNNNNNTNNINNNNYYNNNNNNNATNSNYSSGIQYNQNNNGRNNNINNTNNNHHQSAYNQLYNSSSNQSTVINNNNSGAGGGGGGIGKISDYDPLTDGPRNIPNTTRHSSTLIYSSDRNSAVNINQQQRRIGSVADIDPANGIYSSVVAADQYPIQQKQQHQQAQQQQQQQMQQQRQSQKPQQQHLSNNVRLFRAVYDYDAQDTDEVSFLEGDIIVEIDAIDAGWMAGRIERTGKTGMLPANYVEPAVI